MFLLSLFALLFYHFVLCYLVLLNHGYIALKESKLTYKFWETHNHAQINVREALNSALDEEMSADPTVFLMGEEVGKYSRIYFLI